MMSYRFNSAMERTFVSSSCGVNILIEARMFPFVIDSVYPGYSDTKPCFTMLLMWSMAASNSWISDITTLSVG